MKDDSLGAIRRRALNEVMRDEADLKVELLVDAVQDGAEALDRLSGKRQRVLIVGRGPARSGFQKREIQGRLIVAARPGPIKHGI